MHRQHKRRNTVDLHTQNTFKAFKFNWALMQRDYTLLSPHESNHKQGWDSGGDDGDEDSFVVLFSADSSGWFLYCSRLTASNSLCSFRLTVLTATGILELWSTHGWHSPSVLMPFGPCAAWISLHASAPLWYTLTFLWLRVPKADIYATFGTHSHASQWI